MLIKIKIFKRVEIYLDKVYHINISPIVVKEITDFIFLPSFIADNDN